MSSKAFDQRNKEDFDRNTQTLIKGIENIRANPSLRATMAELARVTGVHRNTISQRGWPQQQLEDVKEHRRRVAAARQQKAALREDPASILADKLEKSRLEVIYWFRRATDAEDRFYSKERESKTFMESKDFYLEQCSAQKATIADLNKQIQQLKGVIELLESEVREKTK